MKSIRVYPIILLLLYLWCSKATDTPALPRFSRKVTKSPLNSKYGDFGRVLKTVPGENQVYIEAEGYYSCHMEDEPSMTVGVTINSEVKS